MGFHGKGGVVRPYLFAEPVGSDRQTRRLVEQFTRTTGAR